MEAYNSIYIKYADYEENKKVLNNNECYKDREILLNKNKNKKKNNKCFNEEDNNIRISNRFNDEIKKFEKNDCLKKKIRNEVYSNINNQKNLYSKKNNKTLTKRIINTIPYKNYKNYEYNPELEVLMQNSNYNGNKKSVNNTGEIINKEYPLINKVKSNINNKNNFILLDRFNLSTRQLKGSNTNYITNYKKNLNNLTELINLN